ncbi:neoverrucotoxin subunit alpha-like [Patiria miniata]|uniref:Stonustoxin-like helical domain-containing protein n=1 Tax=Patiria miniata TaxID=46514 RepID=A0A914BLH4_PATMI|nr:neoverrucotoxin subunit alpha-like [Patiria miniata]
MEGTLELPALGRRMCLGTQYDCRSQKIISPGATLWDQETISKQKKVSEKKSHEVTLVKSHTFNDKFKALEVDESLKASILADLVQPAGSAKFLTDQPPPEGTCRLSVYSKATSVIEELPHNQLGSCKILNLEVITEGKATHVVVGILYGSNTFFVFDKTCGESTEDDCLKSLNALVTNFRSCPEEGEESFAFDPKSASDVECKVHCDLDVEGHHSDYAASELLIEIPDMIKKKAVPVKFFLYPLHKIDSRAARVYRVMSDGLLSRVQEFLEGLERCSTRVSEMAADPLCVDFPQFADKFSFFKRMLGDFKTRFQRDFAHEFPLIQGGSKGESDLKEMLQNAATGTPFKLAELDAWLKSKRKELSAGKRKDI